MDLLRAVDANSFYPAYQKIINTETNMVVAYELLARCELDGEAYYPASFIPKAKLLNITHEITLKVLEIALRDNQYSPTRLNVNFSPDELSLPIISKQLDKLIAKYRYPKQLIRLEITETPCHVTWGLFRDNVNKMRLEGWSFSLDDYGINNQNLQRLIELPVSQIKLDRSLLPSDLFNPNPTISASLNQLQKEERLKRLSIIESIARVTSSANIEVVAEGVETKQVADILTGLGVTIQQGFYHHRPEPFPDSLATSLLRTFA
ncbi:EAL domain-containing protein [Vibrio agarivorans]|uniref:EAL domain-containing protein n=1 Tax=Vibrio agarivorans TaxID=153622 RepID=UPI0025B5D6ED|nr:EAL domain-containing protein [Vibrio agarivorans]MDN3661142.1 EAL domain-containing protein [Vibrio agarivorans]